MNTTFGQKIKELRKELELTQAQIAEYMLMTQSNYSKIERDVREPDLQQLKQLAEIFCVSADYLLDISEDTAINKDEIFARKLF